jgi:hypothetical protein
VISSFLFMRMIVVSRESLDPNAVVASMLSPPAIYAMPLGLEWAAAPDEFVSRRVALGGHRIALAPIGDRGNR